MSLFDKMRERYAFTGMVDRALNGTSFREPRTYRLYERIRAAYEEWATAIEETTDAE